MYRVLFDMSFGIDIEAESPESAERIFRDHVSMSEIVDHVRAELVRGEFDFSDDLVIISPDGSITNGSLFNSTEE